MDTEVRNWEAGSVFNTVEEAIEDIRQGRMVLVADDENRENEGDLIVAAAHATADNVNFSPVCTGPDLRPRVGGDRPKAASRPPDRAQHGQEVHRVPGHGGRP